MRQALTPSKPVKSFKSWARDNEHSKASSAKARKAKRGCGQTQSRSVKPLKWFAGAFFSRKAIILLFYRPRIYYAVLNLDRINPHPLPNNHAN
jgi:hypothetical protein